MMLVVANVVAFVQSVLLLYSTFCKEKKSMFALQFTNSFLGAVSNFMVGSYAAVAVNAVALVRNATLALGKSSKRISVVITIAMVIVGAITNSKGAIGLLAVVASALYTFMTMSTESVQTARIALVINQVLWFVHHVYVGLYTSAVTSVVIATVTIWNFQKFRKTAIDS